MKTLYGLNAEADASGGFDRAHRRPEPGRTGGCIVALGVFDGVHLGHQAVIRRNIEWARRKGAHSMIMTFDRHPRSVVTDDSPLFITSMKHRLMLFEGMGVEQCLVLDFDREMAEMSARDFVESAFRGAVGVVMGYDQRFGRGREGDIALLQDMSGELGFEVAVVEPVLIGGAPVSSTAVRQALATGHLDRVAEMLGRRPSVLGTVESGEGRGKLLGFPTANLDLHGEAHPPVGVYRTETIVNGKTWASVTNVGRGPTFKERSDARGPVTVETHLLDFHGDLMDEEIEVVFLEKIRNEVRCRSEEELIGLITGDVEYARSRIAERGVRRELRRR